MMTLTTNAPLFTRLTGVIRDVFQCPDVPIARDTSSLDIDGWDSLSHTILLLRVEKEFGVRLPLDRTRTLANVGDLADLIEPLLAPEPTPAAAGDEDVRWIILHGNCQMGFLGTLLQPIVEPLGYKVAHIVSTTRLAGQYQPEPRQSARCAAFIEQVSSIATQVETRPSYSSDFPSHCRRLRLPVLWLKSLWPLQCADPRNVRTPQDVGKHPYGDGLVVRLMKEYTDPEEVLKRYFDTDITTMFDLDRLHEMFMADAVASDQLADIPFAAMLEANFRKTRLFDTINHPSHQLNVHLRDIVARFILEGEAVADLQPVPEPMPMTQVPIHPQLIEHFKLEWTSREATHLYFGRPLTFEQYLRAYIAFE